MLELGDYSEQAHLDVGAMAAESKIDYLLAFGNDSRYIIQGAVDNGLKNAYYFDSKEELTDKLIDIIAKDDTILFKASRGMKLEDVIHSVYDRWGK